VLTAHANFCFTGFVPIYEYQCTKGHRFEAIQKVDDPPLKKCEKCKAKAERLISSPAIQFKGSGWYVTDYAKKGSGGEASKEDSSKSKSSDKKASKKSD
jgi:putative FmdB family regulatory protein